MVNFSANAQKFIETTTSELVGSKSKNKYSTRYKFLDMSTRRNYVFLQYHDKLEEIYNLDTNEIYVVKGYVNSQGYTYYLIITSARIDEKTKNEGIASSLIDPALGK